MQKINSWTDKQKSYLLAAGLAALNILIFLIPPLTGFTFETRGHSLVAWHRVRNSFLDPYPLLYSSARQETVVDCQGYLPLRICGRFSLRGFLLKLYYRRRTQCILRLRTFRIPLVDPCLSAHCRNPLQNHRNPPEVYYGRSLLNSYRTLRVYGNRYS